MKIGIVRRSSRSSAMIHEAVVRVDNEERRPAAPRPQRKRKPLKDITNTCKK